MTDPITRLNAALEGRYRIEREIGEGGMATVYLAHDERHNRNVALKVLKPELAAVVGAERFLSEIETTAQLTHPHILPLHDSGEADGFLYYVMPYVEGESLRERLDRDHQLPVDEAVSIATNMAEALDYAHSQGVIHRDIKPANVLMLSGKPVISDFGIALAVGAAGGGRLTETGLSLGTPHYMSPEQATGDQNVGAQADTYALGCVLYEMLVGEPPYTGPNAQAVLGQIITGKTVSVVEKRESVPPNVDAAIRRAFEKVPADRFTAAKEFVRALGDPGFSHGSAPAGTGETGRRLWNPLSAGASALTVVFALAFGWSLRVPLRPDAAQSAVRLELTLPVGVERPPVGQGVHLALSPDGSEVVFVGRSPGDATQLWRRPLHQLTSTPIPGTENARNPRFSPEGASVAFTRSGGLAVASLRGGPPLTLVSDSVPDAGGALAWGPEGMIYFRKVGQGIWRVPATGGEPEEVTMLAEGEDGHVSPDVLPGGSAILFTRDLGASTEDEIAVHSLETGENRTLLQGAMARYADSGHLVYASGERTLFAAPFDADRLEVTGPSQPLPDVVAVVGQSSAYFALSESGRLVYWPPEAVANTGGGTPVLIGRDGSEQVLDSTLTGFFEHPAFSPDGMRLAIQRQMASEPEHIWIYDLDQGTFSRLTFGNGRNIHPFWSPDGSEVGFSSNRDGSLALYSRPWDLSGDTRLLVSDPDDGLYEGGWTPDGKGLVYRRGSLTTTGTQDLYYRAPHPDSTAVAILDTPASENTPSLSPDGRWLAYASDESGQYEVYVRPFQRPGGRSQVSVNGGQNPSWAHSGREILYLGLSGDRVFTVATIRTDPEFAVESRERLDPMLPIFTQPIVRNHALTVDDQKLLVMATDPSVGGGIVAVLNFFEELRQVVPDN